MKKKVNLARALKEKNRVAGKLAQARALVKQENSKDVKLPRGIDVKAVYDEAQALKARLIDIKAAIAVANSSIVSKIIELDELKSEIAYLNGLDVKEGVFEESSYGGKIVREITAIIRKQSVLDEVARLQKRAEGLQDELDEFNASVKVEIELDE